MTAKPSSISRLLISQTPFVLDGALATYLETLGADISSDLWSAKLLLQDPKLIYRTHLDYYLAGASVAITASYQASIPGLIKHLGISEEEAKGIVKKSVELAKDARDDYLQKSGGVSGQNFFVAGSVGPYGAYLADGSEYRGDYSASEEEFKRFHRGRIAALIDAGVDILAIETIPSFSETKALLQLLAEDFPDTEAWFSFTLRDAHHISDGTSLSTVVNVFKNSSHVLAIGVNCVPEELALSALKSLRELTNKPLLAYPNSGEQWNAESRSWYGERNGGQRLAERTKEWWEAGARLIGGCCRTTPEDIKVIAKTLDGLKE